MNVLFNSDKLVRLITNLQTFTGIRTSVLDAQGKDIQLSGWYNDFCRLMNKDPRGHGRCEACDAEAVKSCSARRGAHSYRCHAGVCEFVLPVYESGVPIAYLVFGQLLDDSPIRQQWEATAKTLGWYEGDPELLREAFFKLRQFSRREMNAYAEILEALASYIQQEGMIRSAEYTDLQKLEMYLDSHYMENLSLKRISADLHVGTTKLCALAKKLSGGATLTHLITQRRVEAAKVLLTGGDAPVSAVAGEVGFNDYNYFTKIFKSVTGMTPSTYRKKYREEVWRTESV